jgi:hypothetical protein
MPSSARNLLALGTSDEGNFVGGFFDIVAINRARNLAITNDDRVLPIVSYVDRDGFRVEMEEATHAVVKESDERYWRVRLSDYKIPPN